MIAFSRPPEYQNPDLEIDTEFKEIIEIIYLSCDVPFIKILVDNKSHFSKSRIEKDFPENIIDAITCSCWPQYTRGIFELDNENDIAQLIEGNTSSLSFQFFACVPLIHKEEVLGSILLLDIRKRKLTEKHRNLLTIMSARIARHIVLHEEITEQQRKHHLTYQRLYDITSQTPDYIFTLNADLNITYINHYGRSSRENILNKHVASFFQPEYRDDYIAACRSSLRDLVVIEKDFVIVTPTGNRCYSVKFCPLKNKHGHAESLLIIARDVSSARKIREELIKQQKVLSEAQKISQTGSCEWNLDTDEAIFSDELIAILGLKGQVYDNHIETLRSRIHSDDLPTALELTRNAIRNRSSLSFKYRIVTPKGEIKFIDGRGCPLTIVDDRVLTVLITLHDITDYVNFDKKIFAAVVQSEEKERARMAGELHDGVCQYLAGSKLMLTTIENTLNEANGKLNIDSIAAMVQYSKSTLTDALHLTQQISRNLLPVSFHRKGLFQSVQEMIDVLNSADQIIYVLTTSGEDTELDQDIAINIFRIVQEFIRNSQKYSEASHVNIHLSIRNEIIQLEIDDNGKGFDMNSAELKKGVGLLSMRKRIQSIGGSFTYETAKGKGVRLKLKMNTNKTSG
jgi:signal transduction histidine kinase